MNSKIKKSLYTTAIVVTSLAATFVLIASKEAPQRKARVDLRPAIATMEIVNDNIQLTVPVLGRLVPQEQVQIFSEVSGVLENSAKPFLEGSTYKAGEPMLQISSEENELNVIAQRSSLLMQLTQLLADLKFEYPDSYDSWEEYLQQYEIDKELAPLPAVRNEREKMYVAAQGIYQSYYSIKSLEARLNKYTLYAPFDGTVISSNIKPGALVMNGQNLGEFIGTGNFDLETQVSVADAGYLQIGDLVELSTGNQVDNLTGNVSRISQSVDQSSQMVNVYITVSNPNLKAGQYLEGRIKTSTSVRAATLPRKMITNNQSVFLVKNETILEQPVTVITTIADKVIIAGLENGVQVSTKIQNLYSGLKVKTI